ncbi:probable E3 ubiquitin-protein ligase makorin-2 [Micropterus dolomieu]|uniref:probable E3 ubiquitin-protein ligase makorin-2 n=1 Tax=Micropterus dolomieu TaxID=147949 RepID=UPI001E8D1146|nr:probable E3 ubiquitin-protein ligase makorin-2 [Micropterus dolomieu]
MRSSDACQGVLSFHQFSHQPKTTGEGWNYGQPVNPPGTPAETVLALILTAGSRTKHFRLAPRRDPRSVPDASTLIEPFGRVSDVCLCLRSCPECRVISEFVIPSVYWVEDQEEKDHLIELFKSGVSKKACKYFDQGRGSCPFAGKCLYLHAFPDGTRAEPDRPRKQLSSEGNVRFMNNVRLWDFIEERGQRSLPASLPSLDDDITELRELFMQMSGPSQDGPETPPGADQ